MAAQSMKRMVPHIVRHRVQIAFLAHLFCAVIAYMAAWLVRFDGTLPREYLSPALLALPGLIGIRGLFVYRYGLMRGMCRYFGAADVQRIARAVLASEAIFVVLVLFFFGHNHHIPRSIFVMDAVFTFLGYTGGRWLLKGLRPHVRKMMGEEEGADAEALRPDAVPTFIIGAGDLGETTLRLLRNTFPGQHRILGFVDDDPWKFGVTIHGHPVLGSIGDLPALIEEHAPREVIFAIGTPSPELIHRAVDGCAGAAITFRIVPAVRDFLTGELKAAPMRELALEDLLGRDPVALDRDAVRNNIKGRCILVTGAGGSIGSELARQIAGYGPSRLVLFDNGESALFEIDRELAELAPEVARVPVVGDVRDPETVDRVFRRTRPERVFHAAAYKHVPLMESHPVEAVRNNVHGTLLVARAAERYGVKSFLMISTDKAVRPTNVMGATKRCAELAVVNMPRRETTFVAVRFGNVLGSNGSVVPIFQKQIAAGGPVTVTDPDIERYFMTIPEAVELVLQANTRGEPGDVFVLDMGKPIRIADLARNMIELSGHIPDGDIRIVYTGLRPGEKMTEELVAYGEELQESDIPRLRVLRHVNGVHRDDALWKDIEALLDIARKRDNDATRKKLWDVVQSNDPDVNLTKAILDAPSETARFRMADLSRAAAL